MRYQRRESFAVDAWQWTGAPLAGIPGWLADLLLHIPEGRELPAAHVDLVGHRPTMIVYVPPLPVLHLHPGDWLVRTDGGSYFAYSAAEFNATFAPMLSMRPGSVL